MLKNIFADNFDSEIVDIAHKHFNLLLHSPFSVEHLIQLAMKNKTLKKNAIFCPFLEWK